MDTRRSNGEIRARRSHGDRYRGRSGIGEACAHALSSSGAAVLVVDMNDERAEGELIVTFDRSHSSPPLEERGLGAESRGSGCAD